MLVSPPQGKFTEKEMAEWPQHSAVCRVMLSDIEYEDQYMLVRSLQSADARNHFVKHGFEYRGRLAFNVPFDRSPPWLIKLSLFNWTMDQTSTPVNSRDKPLIAS